MKQELPCRRFLIATFAAAFSLPTLRAQQEVGYIEDFALAANREAVLAQLIPGTEDYYYYHALHYQNTGQALKLAEVLAQWDKRFRNSSQRKMILNRQALLDYPKDPKGSLEYIRRELNLEFNHQQEGKAQAANYPSQLDQGQITWDKFLADALASSDNLGPLTEEAFFPLLASGRQLDVQERRDLLARATLPDLPGLVPLIASDLASKESRGFGEFGIHRELTLAQLDELARLRPELLRNENFVHARLLKLQPGADVNPAANPEAREAYLDAAWRFAGPLDPVFNSLKAHLLYQRLVHDLSRGVYDRDRLMEYVKLPRNSPCVRPEWRTESEELWRNAADLSRDFSPVTSLPPIGGDEPLIRSYLLQFLKDADDFKPWAPYLAESWLKRVLAETKIIHGIGDPERWASMMSPAEFQALKDRVDIEFDDAHWQKVPAGTQAPANAMEFGVDDPVKLRLHVKNVPQLIIKVFEVNPLSYYLEHGREVSTDLELDGLVANHEQTLKFDEPPARRIARDFDFPQIGKRRGIWVVEFIGGGKSSRAVIRKGKLQTLNRIASAGVVVKVLDEARRPVSDGAVWFGGRRFECDDEGRALVPFSTDPGNRSAVIEDGTGFASLASFSHPAEDYALHAGVFVDREALRSNGMAQVVVRPNLTVAGEPISLSRLEAVRLILVSTDLDGVTSTATVPDFKIASDRESVHEMRVPDRLARIDVRLAGKVKVASRGGEELELGDGAVFEVNAQLRTERIDDLYLSRIGGGHVLELLGRSGEPRVGQNVNVQVHRRGFQNPRGFTLKTDGAGGIELGALDGILSIDAEAPGGHRRSWSMESDRRTQPGTIHAVAGTPVRVPFVGKLEREQVALLAVSQTGVNADAFDKLKLQDGFLVAEMLDPGDYRLLLKRAGQAVTVQVAAGEQSLGHVFNQARTLEIKARQPSHIASVDTAGDTLAVKVANADKLTRVHILASRFLPDHDSFASLGEAPRSGIYGGRPGWLPNLYLSGRRIGDEFRYILERRYQEKLPGNLLERPEILLNPWAIRDTEAGAESLAKGEAYDRRATGQGADGAIAGKKNGLGGTSAGGSPRSIDFLAQAPVALLNLQPDKEGFVRIKLDAFRDRQYLQVLVVDPDGATCEQVSLPDRATKIRDLRLLNALDPRKHFTEQDSVTLLKAGDKLVIPDLLTARFEVFDHLGAAYRYLLAVREDPTLREFGFILDWPNFTPEQKREKYSKYACHELSFFLARNDPEFFKQAILPSLSNKKDVTFLDDYLTGQKLELYLGSYEYARLNMPERILLARRLPDRLDAIRRDLGDRLSLMPPDPTRDTFLFEAALASFGMSGDRHGAIDKALMELADEMPPEAAAGAPAPANRESRMRGSLARKPQSGAVAAEPGAPLAEREEMKRELKEMAKKIDAKEKLAETDALRAYRKDEAGAAKDMDAFFADDMVLSLEARQALYRAIETTKEWAENNYYHLPIEAHTFDLITGNKFWFDFARHDGEAGFGSRHIGEASRSFHEAMLALAVLDLPFAPGKNETKIDGAELTFTAGGRAIAFHREIKEARMAKEGQPLLISQSYFRNDDRFRMEDGEKVDKFVTDEFITSVVYGGQTVVTNPTSSRRKLDLLVQIPKGAIPVLGHRATATHRLALEPYTTQRLEVFFYFPAAGKYPCYPAHASKATEVVASAEAIEFNVVDKPTKVDETSWAYISQWGTDEQVLDYLAKQNLHAVELAKIAWRCRESADFMKKALDAIDLRGMYDGTLSSYGIFHNHSPAVRQFLLTHKGFLDSCGLYLASELVTIDPIQRRAYQHLEYKPLVNNRAHKVGARHKILNAAILSQYQQFMCILSQKSALDDEDMLSATYYLFLQDRATEAMAWLDKVNAGSLPTRIQLDYFKAYAAFYRADPAAARAIARRYTGYPVDRWRERFAAVAAQADEIDGKGPAVIDDQSRNQQQQQLAAKESTLDLKVENNEVKLNYANLDAVTVNYHEMDLEFLFSTNPFVSSDSGGFSVVRPNKSERVQLPKDRNEHRFQLPKEYQAKNVLIEIIGGDKKRSQAVYANELVTAVSENFGILTVRHAGDKRALPKVYVKVYAMTGSGPQFYKDGYTDLRGKFDYASVSTTDIADASKFSILVMSEEHGATVLQATVPQR
jgi:hypothetical protein